ncbi:MAG: ion transporter [Alphaproteobacteria bacterium]|nr:ion transporter [Alphaproteobacteria bacterium]
MAEELRKRIHIALEPTARAAPGLSLTNKLLFGLIICSALAAILETEVTLSSLAGSLFLYLEWGFTVIFFVEYLVRLWVANENPKFSDGISGVFRYARTPAAILDLLAIAPILITFVGNEAFMLRLFRLLRVLRLARLGRFSEAMDCIILAVRSRRHELILSFCAAVALLIVSATLLYVVEGGRQPEAFGSIPRAMWWAVSALTTVGYGDVYPITILGKVFASISSIAGIALIAMPTGILAAAFGDALQARRADKGPGRNSIDD